MNHHLLPDHDPECWCHPVLVGPDGREVRHREKQAQPALGGQESPSEYEGGTGADEPDTVRVAGAAEVSH